MHGSHLTGAERGERSDFARPDPPPPSVLPWGRRSKFAPGCFTRAVTSFLVDDSGIAPAHTVLRELTGVLEAADFARTDRLPLPGSPLDFLLDPLNALRGFGGRSNLLQPTAVAGLHRRKLRGRHPGAVDLHRLLTAGETLPAGDLELVLGRRLLGDLLAIGALTDTSRGIRAEILVVPYRGRVYVSDAIRHGNDPDFCYLGRASFAVTDLALAEISADRSSRLLDLGCGPGVGALALSDLAGELVASDLIPRSVRFARLNAALNGIDNAAFVVSDLCDEVEGTFDLVITHPPGTWTDHLAEDPANAAVAAAEGGDDFGLELPQRMIHAALERTRPGGTVYAVLFAPVLGNRPYAADVLRRICADRPAETVLYPYLEYYEYEDVSRYRAHGVTAMVRYLARLRPAESFSVRFDTLDRPRLLSSRARSVPARMAGALTRR